MSEVYIVVEGQTEQTFIQNVLAPYLSMKGISLHASLIGENEKKGGRVRFDRAYRNIANYLKSRDDIYVSSMFDYFGISKSWPGVSTLKEKLGTGIKMTAKEKGEALGEATLKAVCDKYPAHKERFIPYIAMHEFEALLFSDSNILSSKIGVKNQEIVNILSAYETPEDINTEPAKAPSKRLQSLKKGYAKIIMGKVISEKIGIPAIREQCRHFNNWVTRLENL